MKTENKGIGHPGNDRPCVVFMGAITPAEILYAPLLAEIGGEVHAHLKDLEVFAEGGEPSGYSLESEVEGIKRVADEAGEESVHLVGLSAGATSSLAFGREVSGAVREPRARRASSHDERGMDFGGRGVVEGGRRGHVASAHGADGTAPSSRRPSAVVDDGARRRDVGFAFRPPDARPRPGTPPRFPKPGVFRARYFEPSCLRARGGEDEANPPEPRSGSLRRTPPSRRGANLGAGTLRAGFAKTMGASRDGFDDGRRDGSDVNAFGG